MFLSAAAFIFGVLLWNFFSHDRKDLKSCDEKAIYSDDSGMLDRDQFISTGVFIMYLSGAFLMVALGKVC